MKPVLRAISLGLGLFLASGSFASSDEILPMAPGSGLARIPDAERKLSAGDNQGALDDLQAALTDPAYDRLNARQKGYLHLEIAMAQFALHNGKGGFEHLALAGQFDPKLLTAENWRSLAVFAIYNPGHAREGSQAIIQLADNYPNEFLSISDESLINWIVFAGKAADGDVTQLKLLEALWRDHYSPATLSPQPDLAWFSLFEIYVARNQDDKARRVLKATMDPGTVIRLRCDKRYARFATDGPGQGDFGLAMETFLERSRREMEAKPHALAALNTYAFRLMKAGRLDDALTLVDDAIARINAAGDTTQPFDDTASQFPWLYDLRSRILGRQNRKDEMLRTLEKARDMATNAPGPRQDTVSMRLNLGLDYVMQERPQDALNEVKDISLSNASAYGVMVARLSEACAYAQLGDRTRLNATLTYMKEHVDEHESAVRLALTCAGDQDGLAARLIQRLDDPKTRNEMLVDLQVFDGNLNLTAYEQKLDDTRKATLARSDVQEAIARYGEIHTYPGYAP